MSGTVNGVSVVATYTYDNLGRLKTYTPGLPSGYGTISYTYNSIGQKMSMTVPLGAGNKAQKIDYYYDHYGRMVGTDVTSATVTSSSSLSSTTASETQFYYDDNQNRVKMVTKTNNPATYDGTYYFVYDPTASIPAVVYEQGPTYRYLNVRNPDGSLVGRRRYDVDADYVDERVYHFDGLGNTVALSNASGTITDRYSYDAWGKVTPAVGNVTTDNPYQYVGQLGYYTHYQEPSLGLLQLGVRYYDPALGRFTSRDPARDGLNWYTYAGNRPSTLVDPTGLKKWTTCDWFHHYYYGNNRPVDLSQMGLLTEFSNSSQVRDAADSRVSEARSTASRKAHHYCNYNPGKRDGQMTFRLLSKTRHINLTNNVYRLRGADHHSPVRSNR